MERLQKIIAKLLEARLMPVDWNEYLEAVANAYLKAPMYEANAIPSWQALITHIEKLYRQLQSRYQVEFTEDNPYQTADQMANEIDQTGIIRVYSGGTQHPVWTPEQNLQFRAVHDIFAHIYGNYDFSGRGEIASYNRHAAMAPPSALPALFTEVVGQASVNERKGFFPPQKIAILQGFDFRRVGYMDSALRGPSNQSLVPGSSPPSANSPQTSPTSQPSMQPALMTNPSLATG